MRMDGHLESLYSFLSCIDECVFLFSVMLKAFQMFDTGKTGFIDGVSSKEGTEDFN